MELESDSNSIRILKIPQTKRTLREIRAFSQHENESLTDAWLRMKEMLRNFHGHNLSKGNIIKIFYHGLSEINQEVLIAAAGGIFLYKIPNQAYQLLEDKVLLKLDYAKNQKTKSTLKKTVAFADGGSSNSDTDKIMFDRLADKQSGRPFRSFPSNTQPNPKGHNSKAYQPPQSRNEHVNAVFTRSVDLGASINLMSFSLYAKLSLETLKPTKMSVRLADRSFQYPVGIAESMLVEVASYLNDDTCFTISDEIQEENFDTHLNEGSKILHSYQRNPSQKKKSWLNSDKFIAMTTDENSDSESDTEELPFRKSPSIQIIKSKHLSKNLPTISNLNSTDKLKYVFWKKPSFSSIIISSQLSQEKKNKLVSVLKKHKQAFAWKTTDIPGICPSFCKYKIQLLDDKKHVVQKQRKLNPNNQISLKKKS
ncbi:reverse transcriptase domain-containing protein [Tanacetum coccineum]